MNRRDHNHSSSHHSLTGPSRAQPLDHRTPGPCLVDNLHQLQGKSIIYHACVRNVNISLSQSAESRSVAETASYFYLKLGTVRAGDGVCHDQLDDQLDQIDAAGSNQRSGLAGK